MEINNYDIISTIHVNLSTAILGGKVQFSSIKGNEEIYIAAKSQDGDIIRFENQVPY